MQEERIIRRRESYKRFNDIYAWIALEKPSPGEILIRIHKILDGYHAFKSVTNSDAAEESIALICVDHCDKVAEDE